MTVDQHAFVATTRFGMGAAPGELDRAAADPQNWLIAQLHPQSAPASLAQLPGTADL